MKTEEKTKVREVLEEKLTLGEQEEETVMPVLCEYLHILMNDTLISLRLEFILFLKVHSTDMKLNGR
jgi:hypothetical protein